MLSSRTARAERALRDDWLRQKFVEIEGERARTEFRYRGGQVLFNGHAPGTPV